MVEGVWVSEKKTVFIPLILVSNKREIWREDFPKWEGADFFSLDFTTSGNFERIAPGELAKW